MCAARRVYADTRKCQSYPYEFNMIIRQNYCKPILWIPMDNFEVSIPVQGITDLRQLNLIQLTQFTTKQKVIFKVYTKFVNFYKKP